jgi:hypothetical protein
VRGKRRWVELGSGAQDPCDEGGTGDEDAGYHPFRMAVDYNPVAPDRGTGDGYMSAKQSARIARLVRRAKKLRVKVDLEHDGFHTHVTRDVRVRGWTADCLTKGGGHVTYASGTSDPYNRPPSVGVTAFSTATDRCLLEVAPGSSARPIGDPEGDWVSLDWSLDGQLLRSDPPADPNAEEGPTAPKGIVRSFPLDGKAHTLTLTARDQHGGWASASFKVVPHSTRIPATRWPYN